MFISSLFYGLVYYPLAKSAFIFSLKLHYFTTKSKIPSHLSWLCSLTSLLMNIFSNFVLSPFLHRARHLDYHRFPKTILMFFRCVKCGIVEISLTLIYLQAVYNYESKAEVLLKPDNYDSVVNYISKKLEREMFNLKHFF